MVAELANPLVVLAALAAVFAVIEATANIFIASLTLGAVHLVAHGAIGAQAARFAKFFIFGIAYIAIGADELFVAIGTSRFVVGTTLFHIETVAAPLAEGFIRFVTFEAIAATGVACIVQAGFAI